MECIKTGCHAYLEEYGQYVYGDAFAANAATAGRMLILRICETSLNVPVPGHPVVHITVGQIAHWFDEGRESGRQSSTLVCEGLWRWHGYDGIPNEREAALGGRKIPAG